MRLSRETLQIRELLLAGCTVAQVQAFYGCSSEFIDHAVIRIIGSEKKKEARQCTQ